MFKFIISVPTQGLCYYKCCPSCGKINLLYLLLEIKPNIHSNR